MKTSRCKALLLWFLQRTFALYVSRKVHKGHLEVERKFSISAQEAEALPAQLRKLDFQPAGRVVMTDTFLPPRQKGEMLRVRDEMEEGRASSVFTLKSWQRTADGGKERLESEADVSPLIRTLAIMAGRFVCGGELLSFSKERHFFKGERNEREVVVCLDRVSNLGRFSGHFLEVECIVPLGQDPEEARSEIFKFVEALFGAKREDIKQSYMEMLELSREEARQ